MLTLNFRSLRLVLCLPVLLVLLPADVVVAQIRVRPTDPIGQPANPSSPPAPTSPSDVALVGGSVQINSANPALTLSDTATGKAAALRNMGGDLHFSSIVPGQLNTPGRRIDISSYRDVFTVKAGGNVGLGTRDPAHRLTILGGPAWTSNGWKGALELENGSALAWRANAAGQRFGIGHTNGGLYFFRTSSDPATNNAPAVYDLTIKDDGTVSVNTIEINGADLAENFEVRRTTTSEGGAYLPEALQSGLVVSIDPNSPGKLMMSDRPYDRRVAGVISGAGGIGPGVLMGRDMATGDNRYPVALTGRVYCWADTSGGAIRPGDLLTTSARAGHAMRVTDHARAQGAILGKAMGSLEGGTGLVLVLVTLQ